MGIFGNLSGKVRLQVTSADISGSLSALNGAGVILHQIQYDSDLCCSFTISAGDTRKVRNILAKRGAECKVVKFAGLPILFPHLGKRAVLLTGILILILLTIWIPRRIFFVDIEGNQQVSDTAILLSAQNHGIHFGCIRAELRSEELKNEIIEDIPQLDWVGLTTQGCVATITVSEKNTGELIKEQGAPVSNIVANRDGIIEEVTSTKGKVLCKPGQVVYEGQILISGYEDFGLVLKGSNAQGEIIAKTFYEICGIAPRIYQKRAEIFETKTVWTLQIGKNFINFAKDSGISPASCVKMYSKRYVTLPGGFQLPICLIRQDIIRYHMEEEIQFDSSWLSSSMNSYLNSQMLAGEILSAWDTTERLDEIFYINSRYACMEQIGIRKIEESLIDYGKNS